MDKPNCSRCGSPEIARGVRFIDRTEYALKDASLEIRENPRAWLFADVTHFERVADVCGTCGAVELRVKNPRELWGSYQRQQENLKRK